jgi:hypothetical protein
MAVKYEITTPKGIDKKIKQLQNLLFDKLWTSYTYDSYGRSYTKDDKQIAFSSGIDYKLLTGNDKINAFSFFVMDSSNQIDVNYFRAEVSIYFIVDLSKCYPAVTNRADENAHEDVLDILNLEPYGFKPTNITWGADIFEGLKKADLQPYHVFKVQTEVIYQYIKTSC